MKFLTLFAGVVAIANLAYANDAYCPQTKGTCDKDEKPSKEIKGDLVEQIKDEIDCEGTVVVDNACTFTVQDFVFKFNNHTNHNVYWWGSRSFNKGTGAGNRLSSDVVEEVNEKADTSFTVSEDSNCWANLNTDIGTVYLMDDDNKVLCHAIVRSDLSDTSSGGSSGSGSGESGSSGGSTSGGSGTTGGNSGNGTTGGNSGSGTTTAAPTASATTTNKPTQTNKPDTDGASSKFLISSGTLYLVMLALTLYLNH
ncbi:hypothetical protein H8356DRAFT_974456 [Neocallimastix lanati (nom. inval.)]|jgi:hypothetical protein|uniref:Uncharacterized protein n=1 Tax=Neocallimastix californiae TaxID=1754190 RepID=A0A1Y2F455_9FUNG|nr:hypothetical protein H8356DRAFT_974456 [Neocallimastix sp. JGI-2020a]ORY78698.1 hypothetical protein LY90DRAFT_664876 [Neocallimastix californiae]|eukprot:ORY78698.1 hypothetical protein LY90DRAFT_664876 [Neocallimastix californiae]